LYSLSCMKMNRVFYILLIGLLACLPNTGVWAQSQAESAEGSIELQSNEGQKSVTIPVQSKIHIKYTVDPRHYGNKTLDAVLDTSVVISGTRVGVQYLDEITVRNEGRFKTGKHLFWISIGIFLGFILFLVVLAAMSITAIGTIILLAVLTILLGIAASVAMPAGVITGIVLMAISSKTYHLHKDWKVVTHPSSSDD
jgi:hypothetical protein